MKIGTTVFSMAYGRKGWCFVAKCIYLATLRQYDEKHGESNVRLVEMLVDSLVAEIDSRYSLQFWHDVSMYGLKKAIVYLDNFREASNGLNDRDYNKQYAKLHNLLTDLTAKIG